MSYARSLRDRLDLARARLPVPAAAVVIDMLSLPDTMLMALVAATKEAFMPATKEEYEAKLQQELARDGTSRDEAVRRTNVALGYGNSTALQYDVPDDLPEKETPMPPHARPHGGDAA